MRDKTNLTGEFGLSSDSATREFGSLWSETERKTDLALESSDPPKGGAQEFTIPDKAIEFSAAAQTAERKKLSWREHHGRTLLLQMASVGLSAVLVVNSFGGDILGNNMLFGGSTPPSVSQQELYSVDVTSQAELEALPLRPDADRITATNHTRHIYANNIIGYYVDLTVDTDISDLSPLSNLTNLTNLALANNNISDLSPLSNLTNLTDLALANNNISDLSPLSNLTNLHSLSLGSSNISDLSPLSNLTNLTDLRLEYNNISDLSPLSDLTNLTDLRLDGNNISDLTPLAGLTNLMTLHLNFNAPLSQSQVDALQKQLPDCKITY